MNIRIFTPLQPNVLEVIQVPTSRPPPFAAPEHHSAHSAAAKIPTRW